MNGDTQGWMLCSLSIPIPRTMRRNLEWAGGAEMEIRKETVFHKNLLYVNNCKHCLQCDKCCLPCSVLGRNLINAFTGPVV